MQASVVLVLCVISAGTSRHIHEECVAVQSTEKSLLGSRLNLTFFHAGDHREDDSALKMIIEYVGKGAYYDYGSAIRLQPSNVTYVKYRNKTKDTTVESFEPPLPVGWVDLDMTFGSEFQLFLRGHSKPLLHVPNDWEIEKVTIQASNATIDCNDNTVVWEIGSRNVTLPVPGRGPHRLVIFPRNPINPTFTLSNRQHTLGWNNGAILEGEHHSFPPYKEYPLTLQCTDASPQTRNCSLIAGDAFHVGSLPCPKEVCFIQISGRRGDTFSIILERDFKMAEDNSSGIGIIIGITVIVSMALVMIVSYVICRGKANLRVAQIFSGNESLLETGMWDAVNSDQQEEVENLLDRGVDPDRKEPGRQTTASLEAHLLGRTEIVKMFLWRTAKHIEPPNNITVMKVMQKHEERTKTVFEAAKSGKYNRENGVFERLSSQNLPSTIRDSNGWSILHHIANARSPSDNSPVWKPADINKFFTVIKPFPNAVDYRGRTALHIVAEHPSEMPRNAPKIMYSGKSLHEAWVGVAQLLLKNGCDPRVRDHSLRTARDIARCHGNLQVAELLKKESEKLGEVDHESAREKFPELLQAVRRGETSTIMTLLMDHVPILPMTAQEDPLYVALRHKHTENVYLLLGAGAALSNRYIMDSTPFELTHKSFGPALFPALIRQAWVDGLSDELERAKNNPSIARHIKTIRDELRGKGEMPSWDFRERYVEKTKEKKWMLYQAAELGLTLTCQLLGQGETYFRNLPGEKWPLEAALRAGHDNTAYTLCRDFWMTPYAWEGKDNKLSERLAKELLERDLMILKLICKENETTYGQEICNDIYNEMREGKCSLFCDNDERLNLLLYWIAENGLVALLHDIKTKIKLDLNKEIVNFSKTTLLHVAALSNSTRIVEYLLHQDSSLSVISETIGKFSVIDHAAMAKDKDCLKYLITYQRYEGQEWTKQFESFVAKYKDTSSDLQSTDYSRDDELLALAQTKPKEQAYELLRVKAEKLQIRSFDDLQCVAETAREADIISELMSDVCSKMDSISKTTAKVDSRFTGKIQVIGPLADGYEVTSFDTVHSVLELTQLDALSDEADVMVEGKEGRIMKLRCKSKENEDFLEPKNFRKAFMAVMETVAQGETLLENGEAMTLVPPFCVPHEDGVFLHWIWRRDKAVKYFRMNIIPVLKARPPSEDSDSYMFIRIANLTPKWLHSSHTSAKSLMQSVSQSERNVFYMCRFITQLISSRIAYHKHRLSFKSQGPHGITGLQARTLELLFLEELQTPNPSDFSSDTVRERVLSILRKASEGSENTELTDKIRYFYNDSVDASVIAQSVEGIIEFIENLL